jgi:hypothetical protein
LTEAQRERFAAIHRPREADTVLCLWLIVLGPTTFGIMGFVLYCLMRSESWLVIPRVAGLGLFLSAYAAARWHLERAARASAVDDFAVSPVEGPVTVSVTVNHAARSSGYVPRHRIAVSGIEFAASEQIARAFEDGRCYRIYFTYVGLTATMISAEILFPDRR